MNIIGAGLTGCLAGYAFKNAVIHEYLSSPKVHKAVLRFRSDEVSKLTGIPFKRVTVYKAVFDGSRFVNPDIRVMNQYSRKVTGGYHDRSISNLEPSVRYIAPDNFHDLMLDHLSDRINYGSDVDLVEMTTPVISTLPLSVLVNKFHLDAKLPENILSFSPIYITTMIIPDCDVYQTIYYPGTETPIYRASVTGNKLIIEAMSQMTWLQVKNVLDSFGFPFYAGTEKEQNVEQTIGKFNPLEDDYRKQLMYDITVSLGVYSLGRHATWRKILLDDVVHDIHRIESMLQTSAYDRMLGRTK